MNSDGLKHCTGSRHEGPAELIFCDADLEEGKKRCFATTLI